jgi:hypothetical protein
VRAALVLQSHLRAFPLKSNSSPLVLGPVRAALVVRSQLLTFSSKLLPLRLHLVVAPLALALDLDICQELLRQGLLALLLRQAATIELTRALNVCAHLEMLWDLCGVEALNVNVSIKRGGKGNTRGNVCFVTLCFLDLTAFKTAN